MHMCWICPYSIMVIYLFIYEPLVMWGWMHVWMSGPILVITLEQFSFQQIHSRLEIYLRSPVGDPALFASFKDSRPGKEDQGVFHQS